MEGALSPSPHPTCQSNGLEQPQQRQAELPRELCYGLDLK
jgi:hypothetical protein